LTGASFCRMMVCRVQLFNSGHYNVYFFIALLLFGWSVGGSPVSTDVFDQV